MNKPPLGIMPRNLWLEHRQSDLFDAMVRYRKEDKEIPMVWIYEYLDLAQDCTESRLGELTEALGTHGYDGPGQEPEDDVRWYGDEEAAWIFGYRQDKSIRFTLGGKQIRRTGVESESECVSHFDQPMSTENVIRCLEEWSWPSAAEAAREFAGLESDTKEAEPEEVQLDDVRWFYAGSSHQLRAYKGSDCVGGIWISEKKVFNTDFTLEAIELHPNIYKEISSEEAIFLVEKAQWPEGTKAAREFASGRKT